MAFQCVTLKQLEECSSMSNISIHSIIFLYKTCFVSIISDGMGEKGHYCTSCLSNTISNHIQPHFFPDQQVSFWLPNTIKLLNASSQSQSLQKHNTTLFKQRLLLNCDMILLALS